MGEKKDLSPQCIYRDFKYNSLINWKSHTNLTHPVKVF